MSRHWMMYRSQFERGALLTANSAPTDIALSASSIAENAGLGSLLATISGTDPNTGDTLTYSLTNDAGGRFGVSGSNLIVTGVLDYETRPTETITIRATDSGGLTYDKTFTITVTDVAETTPTNPLPAGSTVDDGTFANAVTASTVSGSVKLSGKKSSGSSGKFVYSIAAAPAAGTKYTCQYDPDFTLLSQGGKLAAVGFGLKNGSNFHLMTLMGNGSTGLNVAKVSGSNFSATTGQTITTVGAAHNGTQAGPNWIQLEISSDGLTYTLRTSADGTTWTDEITGATPSPLTGATSATSFGIAAYFDGTDSGSFVIDVKLWQAVLATPVTLSTTDKSSPMGLSNNNLTWTHDATSAWGGARANSPRRTGHLYFEHQVDATVSDAGNYAVGFANPLAALTNYGGVDGNSAVWRASDGVWLTNNLNTGTGISYTNGDRLCFDVDLSTRTVKVQRIRSGAASGWSSSLSLPSGLTNNIPVYPACWAHANGAKGTFSFESSGWLGTAPTGAIAWPYPPASTVKRFWKLDATRTDGTQISINELEFQIGGVDQTSVTDGICVTSNLNGFGWTDPRGAFDNITAQDVGATYGNGWATASGVATASLIYDFGDGADKAIDLLRVFAGGTYNLTFSSSPNGQDWAVRRSATGLVTGGGWQSV